MQLFLAHAHIAWSLAPLPLPPFLGFAIIIICASDLLHIFSTLFFYLGSC